MTNLKPFDDEGFHKVDKALYGHRGSPRYWKNAVAEAAEDLGLRPSKIDNSLYMDPGNFIQYVHVDDEPLSRDDGLVRDMVQKLKQKFLVKKVDYLSKVGECATSSERACARNEFSNEHSLGTAETSDAIPGDQTNEHSEVRTDSQ